MYLEDTIRIEVPPEEVFSFFREMESNFTGWHSDHVYFEWVEGKSLEKGTIFRFEEWIFGELQKKRVRLTDVIPDRYLEFAPTNPVFRIPFPKMTFEMEALGDSATLFRSRIKIRAGTIGKWIFKKYLEAERQHLKEECQNLKKILESG